MSSLLIFYWDIVVCCIWWPCEGTGWFTRPEDPWSMNTVNPVSIKLRGHELFRKVVISETETLRGWRNPWVDRQTDRSPQDISIGMLFVASNASEQFPSWLIMEMMKQGRWLSSLEKNSRPDDGDTSLRGFTVSTESIDFVVYLLVLSRYAIATVSYAVAVHGLTALALTRLLMYMYVYIYIYYIYIFLVTIWATFFSVFFFFLFFVRSVVTSIIIGTFLVMRTQLQWVCTLSIRFLVLFVED